MHVTRHLESLMFKMAKKKKKKKNFAMHMVMKINLRIIYVSLIVFEGALISKDILN